MTLDPFIEKVMSTKKFKYQTSKSSASAIGVLILLFMSLASGCSDDEPSLTESFFKIYDDSNFDVSYRPIDIVETVDGYIILTGTQLSNSNLMGVRLLKVDEEGNYEFDNELDDYVVPIGEMYLNESDSNSYFFAMNPVSLEAVLIGVNPQLEVEIESLIGGVNYPLSSSITSSGTLLLQSYDPIAQETEISEIALTEPHFIRGNSYSIGPGDDVLEEIDNHYLNASERPLPFFCGEVSPDNYYFNGFYNYNLALVFTNFGDSPTRAILGQDGSNVGLRAVLPLSSTEFAVAGFQFNANYQLSSTSFPTNNTESLFPGNMAELKPYTPAKIILYDTYSVFASETKGRQILLNFYGADGSVAGTHRVGYLNPFTFSSMKVGSDNSLLILGTTFVAGRFERIALTKISAGEISGFTN